MPAALRAPRVTLLAAIRVKGPVGLVAPSIQKLPGSRSAASFAEYSRIPLITDGPRDGVTIKPDPRSRKFKYFVVVLSIALSKLSAAGGAPKAVSPSLTPLTIWIESQGRGTS